MSNLQRKVLGGGAAGAALPMAAPRLSAPGVLPPTAPPTGRRRPGSFRRRSYSPVSWKKYWETKEQLKGGTDILLYKVVSIFCLSRRISLTAEPILFSFTVKLLIGPGKVF